MDLQIQLTERKKVLLSTIIKDYINNVEPLGSRTICKRHGFDVSPATIRNEMAELEEAGLLYQPHTSAGRIPSDQGYRFFVNHLMAPYVPTPEEHQFLSRLQQTSKAVDAILSHSIRILSKATHSIVVAEAPTLRHTPVKGLHMTPIDDTSMVLTLTYSNGIQRQSLINLAQPVYSDMLSMLTNYLNAHLDHTLLDELFHKMATFPLEREIEYYKNAVLDMVSEIYSHVQREEKIYLSGTSHLLKEPEFQTTEKAYPILQFLEHDTFVRQLLQSVAFNAPPESEVYCVIGNENSYHELQDCSLIATRYYIDSKASGMIGVIGPTRIDYPKVMSLVQSVAGSLTQVLTKLFT